MSDKWKAVDCAWCKAPVGADCVDKGWPRKKPHPSREKRARWKEDREYETWSRLEKEREFDKKRWPDGDPTSWKEDHWYRVCDVNTGELQYWTIVRGRECQGQRDVQAVVEEKAGAFRWEVYFPWTGDVSDIGYEKSLSAARRKARKDAAEAFAGLGEDEDEDEDEAGALTAKELIGEDM